MNPITHAEASRALAEAMATQVQVADGLHYYVTGAPAEVRGEVTVYMVGYAAVDPEESDEAGTPTAFITGPDGRALMTGPAL